MFPRYRYEVNGLANSFDARIPTGCLQHRSCLTRWGYRWRGCQWRAGSGACGAIPRLNGWSVYIYNMLLSGCRYSLASLRKYRYGGSCIPENTSQVYCSKIPSSENRNSPSRRRELKTFLTPQLPTMIQAPGVNEQWEPGRNRGDHQWINILVEGSEAIGMRG